MRPWSTESFCHLCSKVAFVIGMRPTVPAPIKMPKAPHNTTNINNSIFISKFPPTASDFLCSISRYFFFLSYRQNQNRTSNKRNSFVPQGVANMEYMPIQFFITKYS